MPRRLSTIEKEELTASAVELSARGKNDSELAEILGHDRRTIRRYINNELARRAEIRDNDVERHLAVYNAIQQAAWERLEKTDTRSLNSSGFLNTIKAAEDSKVKLTGAEAPKKHKHEFDMSEGISEEDLALLAAAEAYLDASEDESS